MCYTPEYEDRSLGSFVYRIIVTFSDVCDTPEYVARSLGSSVYRVTVSLANMCVAHMNTWIEGSIGSFVYIES